MRHLGNGTQFRERVAPEVDGYRFVLRQEIAQGRKEILPEVHQLDAVEV